MRLVAFTLLSLAASTVGGAYAADQGNPQGNSRSLNPQQGVIENHSANAGKSPWQSMSQPAEASRQTFQHQQPMGSKGQVGSGQIVTEQGRSGTANHPMGVGPQHSYSAYGSTEPSGPDAWRYRWFNGRWWYWLPDNRWTYWENDHWVDYSANVAVPNTSPQSTFEGGAQMGYGAGYNGYQPYSGNYMPYDGEGYPASTWGGHYSPGWSRGSPSYGPGWGWGRGWNGYGYGWR